MKYEIQINLAVYKNSGKIIKFESDINNWLSGKINQKHGNLSVKSFTFENLLKIINLSNINFAKFNIEGVEKYLIIRKRKFIKICSNVCISFYDFLDNKDSHTFY
jgi:hypothetical protein